MWKLARETRGARVDEVHREMTNTAAATATPARDCSGLGARFDRVFFGETEEGVEANL